MSDRPSENLGGLDMDLAHQIDVVCRRFEAAWRKGRQPCVEDYLAGLPDEGRAALRAELGPLERELRQLEETLPRLEAGSATSAEPLPAPPPSTVAEAPTIASAPPPTAPLPGAATAAIHDDVTLRRVRRPQSITSRPSRPSAMPRRRSGFATSATTS